MSRKPKPRNTLTAGERVAIYNAQKLSEEQRQLRDEQIPKADTVPAVQKKPDKEKPQYASVNVDFSVPSGKIKPLHGMCNGPVSFRSDLSDLYRKIGVPYVRLNNPETGTYQCQVNVSGIFPDALADENDERSYFFSATDKYISSIYNTGAKIILSFGDKTTNGKESLAFTSTEKWVTVIINIIKHYNEYWAHGFAYDIDLFEICPVLSDKYSNEEIFNIYAKTVRAIRIYSSSIKVGGISFDSHSDELKSFVRFCRKNRLPLDYLSVRCFSNSPCKVKDTIDECINLLRNYEYDDAYVILSEWNYIPALPDERNIRKMLDTGFNYDSDKIKEISNRMSGIEGASFVAATLLELNCEEGAINAFYYCAEPVLGPYCGICDRYGNPEKTFYAFSAYNELYRANNGIMCISEQNEGMLHSGIYAKAAVSDDGCGYILLSSFEGCGMVDLRIDNIPDNIYNADVYMVDGVKNLTLCDSVPLSGMMKRLLLNMSKYGIALIKLH